MRDWLIRKKQASNNSATHTPFIRFVLEKLSKMLGIADFVLPMLAWETARQVLISIAVASFLVNILALAFPLALLQIYDRVIPNVAMNTLVLLIMGVGGALLLELLLRVGRSYVGAWADAKFEHIIGCKAFNKLLNCPLADYESDGSGIYMKRLNSLTSLRDFYAGQAIISLVDIPFVIILLLLIAYVGSWLVMVPLIMVSVYLTLAHIQAKHLQNILESRQVQDERRMNFIIETLSNIHTVKAITMEAQMMRRYERLQKISATNDFNLSLKGGQAMVQGQLLSQLTIVLVVALGSTLVINGLLTVGGLAACTLLSGRCLQPVNAMVNVWMRLKAIKIARKELDQILSLPTESAATLPEIGPLEGHIEYRNIMLRYKNKKEPVLKQLNFKINAKESIGVTGASLSGKSSLLWLLLRMILPTQGEVLLDGNDISQFQIDSIRAQIGYMPQQGALFHGTIMENLTMFEEDRYFNEAYKVAEAIGLTEIIEHLPQGYDTLVADQAIETLPRGLKQRICIARALIRKPSIVVFDEANTALDMQSDAILKKMLMQLRGQCTLILISHRPSILNIAQRQFKLEGGQLIEQVAKQ